MRRLKIQYKQFFIFRKTKELDVPEKWHELNGDQFSVCSDIYLNNIADFEFASRFFSISKRITRRFSKFELYKLTELCTFAARPNGSVNFFYMQVIPGTGLMAPKAKFRDVDFERFALFDTYFFMYIRDHKNEDLCRFIAALYLKKNESVTDIDFEKRIKYIRKHVDEATRNAIFMNYIFIHKWLEKPFPLLFESKSTDDRESTKRGITKKTSTSLPDWTGILDAFVGDDILNYDHYKKTNCILMFKRINARIKTHQTK